MITLLGALLGFVSSAFPDVLKLYQDSKDRQHELLILRMQMDQQREGYTQRLDEIQLQHDSAELRALYKTYQSGVAWVDALNGTVRPVLAYAFFLLYFAVKMLQVSMVDGAPLLPWQVEQFWSENDQAIFAGIISFYFGQRAMRKVRER